MSRRILSSFKFFNMGQKLFNYLHPQQYVVKFFQNCRSHKDVSNYIIPAFLPSLLFVKALSKQENNSYLKLINEADSLYDQGQYGELYEVLKVYKESNDPEVLWRLARAIFEKCKTLKEDKEKLGHLEEALQFVDEALEINEGCCSAHKWRAILLDYVWRYKSTKGRIIHSFDVKKHMERAIELNPADSTSYFLLGEWCFTFANMPWYQRKVAAAIFASPPSSSYEEALAYYQKAEKISPLFYSKNLLMIAKCFLKLNEKEQSLEYLKKLKDYPIKTTDDQEAHDEAEKLLKNLNM